MTDLGAAAPRATSLSAASAAHLHQHLMAVEARVRGLVELRRRSDPDPEDRFRGLYVSDDHVDRMLAGGTHAVPQGAEQQAAAIREAAEAAADEAEAAGADLRLRRLARTFGLDDVDIDVLLIALAPDLDPRYERLYGYLNDDVSRRRATVALALELCGHGHASGAHRMRFSQSSALVAGGLLVLEDEDRPLLLRSLRVPDRVAAHLLGDDTPDPSIRPLLVDAVTLDSWHLDALERSLRAGADLFYLQERPGSAGLSVAATALERAGLGWVVIDAIRIAAGTETAIAAVAAREARLRDAALVVVGVDSLAEHNPWPVRPFGGAPGIRVLIGSLSWDPEWAATAPLIVEAPVLTVPQRAALWLSALDEELDGAAEPARIIAPYRLTPEQIVRAAAGARLQSESAGRDPGVADLQAGARMQNAAGLERLAQRITPSVGWDDLVLPRAVLTQLRELAARTRHRDLVLDEWRVGATSARGRGVAALFAGDSGTGKTMSAEVIGGALGLDLYHIDLSSVVDKYIGETEKNLDRIFEQADRVNGVLLFDEADALFGKRSEVSDARDRYANVEVAYLLQRMERFDGVAILTTNLRSNLDEAFTRRLDAIVDFPPPDVDDRRLLWAKHLRPEVPQDPDLDLDFLARAFKLSGGEIRNITVTAAYLAADEGGPVTMAHLVRGTEREYRKLGRMCVQAEFGPYWPVISGPEPTDAMRSLP